MDNWSEQAERLELSEHDALVQADAAALEVQTCHIPAAASET
ncbi:hypothetical protein [Paenibacillus silvisoli]|nr:hypothetical protein [Paenibacillus silvisoli]